MRVTVLHHAVGRDASVADQDVLLQVEAVTAALRRCGMVPQTLAVSLNLEHLRAALTAERPTCVFNLVESLGGTDRLMVLAPLLLEALGIPYTGSRATTLLTVNDKLAAKHRMLRAGLPTPAWWSSVEGWQGSPRPCVIVKAVSEHASLGLGDGSLVDLEGSAAVAEFVKNAEERFGYPHFAEAYIEGREFNLSVLGGETLQVLPVAEIDFSAFGSGRARIVGHDAKWVEDSFEYQHTPRTFDFGHADAGLLDELQSLAYRACLELGVVGYARVDFRVDARGTPWILEVNANPCLSPDAGFAAALERAGIDYDTAIARIVDAALHSSPPHSGGLSCCSPSAVSSTTPWP